jgi:ATP-dependent exoDNAse (exonuclease V) beta subunit
MTDSSNDREQAIRNIGAPQFVCAAAGTGKTSVLVERYLEILLSETADSDQIVAITFTDKAADEMKDRLRAKLIENFIRNDPQKITDYLDRLNIAPIATVHSFCVRLLRDNVNELPFDPLFEICDETAEAILRDNFRQKFFDRKLAERNPGLANLIRYSNLGEIAELLDQIYAKQTECRPLLERYYNLEKTAYLEKVEDDCRNHNLRLLTEFFTDQTVQSVLPQIAAARAKKPDETLQLAFDCIVSAANEVLNLKQIPAALWDGSLRRALDGRKKGAASVWGDDLEFYRNLQNQLHARFEPVKDAFINFDPETEAVQFEYLQSLARLALEFLNDYETEMRRNARLDFTGIETETEKLLAKRSPAIVRYVRHFKHLLVDEFQDINPIQYRIIRLLQELNPALITFFVGDEKQSIYRFRGAEVEIFNTLRRRADVKQLTVNYRSARNLMEFFNYFFTKFLGKTIPAEKFEVYYPVAIAAHDESAADRPLAELILLEEDPEFADLPREQKPTSEMLEARAIAARIRELHGAAIVRENNMLRPATYGDMTILLRSRTHQGQIEMALRQAGIPFYVLKGIGYYDQPEVIDLLNFLCLLLNWHDEVALTGVLRSPLVGLNDFTLTILAKNGGLFEGVNQFLRDRKTNGISDEEVRRLDEFYRHYKELSQQVAQFSTAEILNQIVVNTNYLPVLAGLPEGAQKIANIKKLIDLVLEWEAAEKLPPIDFIRRIRIYRTKAAREGEANLSAARGDAVTLMTVHAAKGLDCQIAILPFLAENFNFRNDRFLFHPVTDTVGGAAVALKVSENGQNCFYYEFFSQLERRRTLAEEKRLLYVAMTRARSYLVCSGSPALKESGAADKSLWDLSADIFNGAGAQNLCAVRRCTKTEIINLPLPEPESVKPAKELSADEIQQIRTLIQPVSLAPTLEKLTATAFAEKIVAAEKPHYPAARLDSGQPLSPTERGTLIHKAFSWWDFQSLDSFQTMLCDLLRPHYLTAAESQAVSNEFSAWARMLLSPDNRLQPLIKSAKTIQREVEVMGLFGETVLEGKIDLLLENGDGSLSIIDFKSDQIDAEPDPVLMKKYATQLDFYAFILERCAGQKVREHAVYFIRTGLFAITPISAAHLNATAKNIREILQVSKN